MLNVNAPKYSQLETSFREIKLRAQRSSSAANVIICVALDCDALCAASILMKLLSIELIPFAVYPVSGYTSLQEAKSSLDETNEARSLILINCGGLVDLNKLLDPLGNTVVYVFDSLRPFHLANIYSEEIVVFEDAQMMGSVPEITASDQEDDDDVSSESDEDDEFRGRRRRLNMEDVLGGQDRREKRRRKAAEVAEYYKNTYCGAPSSNVMYSLASQLNKDTNAMLWLAIIGMTDQLIHERVDSERYHDQVQMYMTEVSSKNVDAPAVRTASDGSTVRVAEQDRISFAEEHWNLFDSMYHSTYLATRLGIWQDAGVSALKQFITRMGIPLADMQQHFGVMSSAMKERFFDAVRHVASSDSKFKDMYYDSFVKQHDYDTPISAADVVYSVNALLEFGSGPQEDDDTQNERWKENYHLAFRALSNLDTLRRGMQQAMTLQQSVVRVASSIIVKKMITSTEWFRYVVLEQTADTELFQYPLALSKLALFLVDAIHERRSRGPPALMMCMYIEKRNMYLIVGVMGRTAGPRKNPFGAAFLSAAQTTKARVHHDTFDTAVMEIEKEDLKKFMECLYSGLVRV